MTPEQDRLLLDLSLEFASAKESIAALEAFRRYVEARFRPESQLHRDSTASGQGEMLSAQGGNLLLRLPLSVPVEFELKGCEGAPPSERELDCVRRIIAAFRERMEEVATLKGLTYTDDLTGLYNQRYLEVILDRELSLAKRNQVPFSVLFLDMDHFKQVNDTHGHLIGSRLLYEVGQEIKRTLRESDVTFRYGGDEFLLILSHTALNDAMVVAERIRLQVEKKRFLAREGLDIRLTASIGVASVPEHATTKMQILKAADEALYGVKKAVRNKVIAATSKMKD